MNSLAKILVIISLIKFNCYEYLLSKPHIEESNNFEIGEMGIVPCLFPNLSAIFHKLTRIKFFKAGVKNIYT